MKRAELTPLSRVYSLPLHWRAAKKKGGPPSLLQSPLERLLSGFLARLWRQKKGIEERRRKRICFLLPPFRMFCLEEKGKGAQREKTYSAAFAPFANILRISLLCIFVLSFSPPISFQLGPAWLSRKIPLKQEKVPPNWGKFFKKRGLLALLAQYSRATEEKFFFPSRKSRRQL